MILKRKGFIGQYLKHSFWALSCILCLSVFGQDHHYTLVNLSPLRLNPALTGVFENDFRNKDIRFSSHYRDQWRSVNSQWTNYQTPFVTTSLGLDSQLKLHKIVRGDYAGWGVHLLYDQSGDLKLSSTDIAVNFAYHKVLNRAHNMYLSLGGSYTHTLRKIDYNQGVFDNQWTGLAFDPSAATGESFSISQFNFEDYKAGALFQYFPDYPFKFKIGYSLHHLNEPNQTFFLKDESNTLKLNNIFHGSLEYPLKNPKRSIISNAFFQSQAAANEFKIAAYYKFKIEEAHHVNQFLQFGLGMRQVGSWQKEIDSEALYFAARYGYGDLIISLAYDTNVSGLVPATNTIGAFEISIIYYEDLFRKIKQPRKRPGEYRPKCPKPVRSF